MKKEKFILESNLLQNRIKVASSGNNLNIDPNSIQQNPICAQWQIQISRGAQHDTTVGNIVMSQNVQA